MSDFVCFLEYSRQFFLTVCLVVSVSQELCLNSVWSESMKYRASPPPLFFDSLPCGFSVSGTLPKFCAVWKYEIQGVALVIFFLTVCLVGLKYEIQGVTLAIFC